MEVGLILLMVGIAMLGVVCLVYQLEKRNVYKYTKSDMVDFGNYILSEERENKIECVDNRRYVNNVDFDNWEDK